MVERLEARLDALAAELPRDPRGVPMTGAAGGLSGGLWAAYGAELEPGAPFILDALDFDARMRAARAVVTGEGKLDEQTLEGKLVGEIGTRTRQAGVPLHAIVGTDRLDAFGKRIIDLQVVQEATDLAELEAAGERLGRGPRRRLKRLTSADAPSLSPARTKPSPAAKGRLTAIYADRGSMTRMNRSSRLSNVFFTFLGAASVGLVVGAARTSSGAFGTSERVVHEVRARRLHSPPWRPRAPRTASRRSTRRPRRASR